MPHLTIVKMSSEEQAQQAYILPATAGRSFDGSRRIRSEELTFVREQEENCWVDRGRSSPGRSLVQR